MAVAQVATGASLVKVAIAEKLYRQAAKETYFTKFIGKNGGSIVRVKEELSKDTGETVKIGFIRNLTGDAIPEGTPAAGREEALYDYDMTITLSQYRKPVAVQRGMTEQRSAYDVPKEAEEALKRWASEYLDQLFFTAALDSPTKVLYRDGVAGAFSGTTTAATAKTAMAASNSAISLNFISAIRTWAETGGDGLMDPIKPVMVEGSPYYVLLTSPNVKYSLETLSEFQTAQREAADRGKENPLFKNSVAIWQGVVVHAHRNVTEYTNGGSGGSIRYAPSVLLGEDALLQARGRNGGIIKDESVTMATDYGEICGYCWKLITKVTKRKFNNKDYGSVGVYIACPSITGV